MAMKKKPDYEIAQLDVDRVRMGIARCLVQWDGDQLTGYTWVWLKKLAYIADGFYLNLPDDAIYNYKALTLPAYRGFGFQGLRHVKLLELLRPDGIRQLFGFVASENTRSFRGVRKSGYQVVGELLIRKTGQRVQTRLRLNADFWPGKPVLDDMGCPMV
ncbi:acyl-CoA N-acyltransferase [Reinekea forsetii]|uniref:Acyl-CoA N-acyltransferase n=2 Tax=Reinekea forsetii TaxID=1336806 RepID=A0A2K8KNA3_9GAMM|nr:acyl-CoA N-acyltransferase [Reinekea forsetii]